ncbi:hypothetical protein P9112_004321 [Eukaryota sp. TZLM1-RC]
MSAVGSEIFKHKYYYRLRQTGKTKEEIESLLAATTTLYVGNLSFYTSEEQIHALFSLAGGIKRINMGLNKKSLKLCGFCLVEYYSRASTEMAMRYINRTIPDEREILIVRLKIIKACLMILTQCSFKTFTCVVTSQNNEQISIFSLLLQSVTMMS